MSNNDWVKIGEIAQWAESTGYWMVLKSPFEPGEKWMAGFTVQGASGWNGKPDFMALADTALEAVEQAFKLMEESDRHE